MEFEAIRDLVGRMLAEQTLERAEAKASVLGGAEAQRAAGIAAAFSGHGLDAVAGERVLAAVSWRHAPLKFVHAMSLAITDHRTIVGAYSNAKNPLNELSVSVRHEELVGVEFKEGWIRKKLALRTAKGLKELAFPLLFHAKLLGGFYQALLKVPAETRALTSPAALFATGTKETNGAHLWHQDERAKAMLESLETGPLDPQSKALLAQRIVLTHRAQVGFPIASGGRFLLPVSMNSARQIVSELLGEPAGSTQVDAQTWRFDYSPELPSFRAQLAAEAGGRAIGLGVATAALTAMGLGVRGGAGLGMAIGAAIVAKGQLGQLSITLAPDEQGCAYELYGDGRALHLSEGVLAYQIHAALLAGASQLLPEMLAPQHL